MGWQRINSLVRRPAGGSQDYGYSEGFLVGTGHEEGFYCFRESPYVSVPFISDAFMPHLEFDGGTVYGQLGLAYNDDEVYGDGTTVWIFKPRSQSGSWVRAQALREPYYYTDIDETTVVGDKFYKGDFPDLNGGAETWTIAGAYTQGEAGSTVSVKLVQDIWEWQDNYGAGTWTSGSRFCGRYYNAKDGTWKFVGIPTYRPTQMSAGGYFNGELFTRGGKDSRGSFTYVGTRGHTITHSATTGKWRVESSEGHWSEATDEPSMSQGVAFQGMMWDPDQGVEAADPNGNFMLQFAYFAMGQEKRDVLMGEVSIWRPLP